MPCPRCQHENPPQAKFCLECGARLAQKCALVLFPEGQERGRRAIERPVEPFRQSRRWPKWHLDEQN